MFPNARIEKVGRRLADLGISLMTSAPADTTIPPVEFLKNQPLREFALAVFNLNDFLYVN